MSGEDDPVGGSNGDSPEPGGEKVDGERNPRQVLLEESRSTVSRQIAQLDKLDGAAVRTIRIELIILTILIGGTQVRPLLELGTYGSVSTVSAVISLLVSAVTYGTYDMVLGSGVRDIEADHRDELDLELVQNDMLDDYEGGIGDNRALLRTNGFLLTLARAFLVISVLAIVAGFIFHTPSAESASGAERTVKTLIGSAT